jgi:hypothetical protein
MGTGPSLSASWRSQASGAAASLEHDSQADVQRQEKEPRIPAPRAPDDRSG